MGVTVAPIVLVVTDAGVCHALKDDECVDILKEAGFVGPPLTLVRLCDLPVGLNAEELGRYLHDHGETITGRSRGKQ